MRFTIALRGVPVAAIRVALGEPFPMPGITPSERPDWVVTEVRPLPGYAEAAAILSAAARVDAALEALAGGTQGPDDAAWRTELRAATELERALCADLELLDERGARAPGKVWRLGEFRDAAGRVRHRAEVRLDASGAAVPAPLPARRAAESDSVEPEA